MKRIKLTQNKFALVDDEDYESLNQWRWYCSNHGYAARKEWIVKTKKYRTIYMHRLINQTHDGFETDHINRDKLDNRGENLRDSTRSRNQMNKGIPKNNTSGYKGLFFEKTRNKWRIRLSMDKKRISFGYYNNFENAVMVYKNIQRKYSL